MRGETHPPIIRIRFEESQEPDWITYLYSFIFLFYFYFYFYFLFLFILGMIHKTLHRLLLLLLLLYSFFFFSFLILVLGKRYCTLLHVSLSLSLSLWVFFSFPFFHCTVYVLYVCLCNLHIHHHCQHVLDCISNIRLTTKTRKAGGCSINSHVSHTQACSSSVCFMYISPPPPFATRHTQFIIPRVTSPVPRKKTTYLH
jgi:hypothetical protein